MSRGLHKRTSRRAIGRSQREAALRRLRLEYLALCQGCPMGAEATKVQRGMELVKLHLTTIELVVRGLWEKEWKEAAE